jgi:hypothetical protein
MIGVRCAALATGAGALLEAARVVARIALPAGKVGRSGAGRPADQVAGDLDDRLVYAQRLAAESAARDDRGGL